MGADFIFACARVRGAERNLLGREKLGIMTEAKTMEDALKVLSEAQYGNEGEVTQPEAYERLLEQETTKLYDFMKEIAPGEEAFKIFSYPFDYHNIKALLKAEFLGTDAKSILMSGGTIDPAAMAVLVKERNYMGMTRHMRAAIEESVDTHARTKDPQCVDLICDRECYADIYGVGTGSNALDLTSHTVRHHYPLLNYSSLLYSTDDISCLYLVTDRRRSHELPFFLTIQCRNGNTSCDVRAG